MRRSYHGQSSWHNHQKCKNELFHYANRLILNEVKGIECLQDEAGNAKVGKDIRLYECKNCVVHTAVESKVVVQGLDGYIVAEKNGQLLVCSLKEEQRIKEFGK